MHGTIWYIGVYRPLHKAPLVEVCTSGIAAVGMLIFYTYLSQGHYAQKAGGQIY